MENSSIQSLDPWYISGFVDGEGCFSLVINTERRKRKEKVSIYSYWIVDFSIHVRADDEAVLRLIQNYFGAGRINMVGSQSYRAAHFNIRERSDLVDKVIDHFDKYPLVAKKRRDYELWREAVMILEEAKRRKNSVTSGQCLTGDEERRLYKIRDQIAERLTNKNKVEFSTVRRLVRTGKRQEVQHV